MHHKPHQSRGITPSGRTWYVRKEVGECAKRSNKPPKSNNEKPSSILSNSTVEVKPVNFPLASS